MSPLRERVWDGQAWVGWGGDGPSMADLRDQLGPFGTYAASNDLTPNSVGAFSDTTRTDVEANVTEAGAAFAGRISIAPGVYNNLTLWGELALTGSGTYVFNNCETPGMHPQLIEDLGQSGGAQRGVVRNYNTSRYLEFNDCTADGRLWETRRGVTASIYASRLNNTQPQNASQADNGGYVDSWQSAFSAGFSGCNIKMRRCEITRFQDLLVFIGDNWDVEGSWLHENFWGCRGIGSSSDWYTHADLIQTHRGKHWRIKHNFLGGLRNTDGFNWSTPGSVGYNAGDDSANGIMLQQENWSNNSALFIEDVDVDGNIFCGCGAASNVHYAQTNDLDGLVWTNNRYVQRTASNPRNDSGADLFVSPQIWTNPNATFSGNRRITWEALVAGDLTGYGTDADLYTQNNT